MEKSVVIVGNGASLLGGGQGPWIDRHDIVVRFNLFQIERFERDAGTRATVWFNNRDADSPAIQRRLKQYAWDHVFMHTWLRTAEALESFARQAERLRVKTPVSAVEKEVITEMTAYLGQPYSMFSTGAIGVWLMLRRFRHVDLIGFDWWNPSPRFHYCDDARFVHDPKNGHQPLLEKALFDRLVEEKRLSIFNGDNPSL